MVIGREFEQPVTVEGQFEQLLEIRGSLRWLYIYHISREKET
jgi:hypothetical protein